MEFGHWGRDRWQDQDLKETKMSKKRREIDRPPILSDFKHAFTHEWLDLEPLRVPQEYQRDLNDKRIQKIAEAFNPFAVGALLVIRRGKTLYLADGEHRKAALFINGHTEWHCLVLRDELSLVEESTLWKALNKNRANASSIEMYHADIVSLEPWALDVRRELQAAGWEIPRKSRRRVEGYGHVVAVSTLKSIHSKIGREGLRQTITIIRGAWGDLEDKRVHEADFLSAVSVIVSTEAFQKNPNEGTNTLITRLVKIPPSKLEKGAKLTYSQVRVSYRKCLATEIAKVYNKGLGRSRQIIIA